MKLGSMWVTYPDGGHAPRHFTFTAKNCSKLIYIHMKTKSDEARLKNKNDLLKKYFNLNNFHKKERKSK